MATQTLTGTQVPLDAASILNMLLGNQLTQRGQDVTQRGQDLSYFDSLLGNQTTQRGQDIQLGLGNAQIQANLKGVYADYVMKGVAASAQYYRDVATVGLEQARLNYEQRLADANIQLQTQSQKLQDVQQGYQQRQGAADTKLKAMQMLADRSGPQDMFKYARLLGGLGTPVEMGQTVDPTKFADNLVDFRYRDPNKDSGIVSQPASVNRPVDVLSSMPKDLNIPDLGGFLQMPNVSAPAPVNTSQFALPPRISQLGTTGTGAGDFWGSGGSDLSSLLKTQGNPPGWGGTVTNNQSAPNAGDTAGNFIGLPNSAVAGLKPGSGGMFTTGYGGPSKASDWMSGYQVSDPATGHVYQGSEDVPGGMPVWVTRLAKGTGMDPKAMLAMLTGKSGGAAPPMGMTNDRAMLTGDAPMNQPPDAGGAKPEAVINPTGAPLAVLNAKDTKELLRLLMKLHGGEETGEPSQTTGEETQEDPEDLKDGGKDESSEPDGMVKVAAHMRRRAGGTRLKDALARHASGTYGMPDLPTYTTYDLSLYGDLPFVQKLKGQAASPAYQGFGANLSNPTFGVFNMPDTLNLRDFYNLSDSEQKASKGLYEDVLATNFNDILGRSRKGAPVGQALGATRYVGMTR